MKAAHIAATSLGAVPLPPDQQARERLAEPYAAGGQWGQPPYVPHQAQPPSTAAPVQYVATPAQQWAPPPPPQPGSAVAPVGGGPMCIHGPRTAISGNSAKGPWTLYFCALPKGTPGACGPIDKNGKELPPR